MCNAKKLKVETFELTDRYDSQIDDDSFSVVSGNDSAFDHNASPIIRADQPHLIDTSHAWRLIPESWRKDYHEIWNSTYNAKIEELHVKYSYKNITHQRCLIPAPSYFEYHWNDPKGKSKTLYEIVHPDSTIFSLGGLYSTYKNYDGTVMNTYTIITTEGNERMQFVHNKDALNNYFRMPLMLNPEDERSWLDLKIPYLDFAYPNYQPRLIAEPAAGESMPPIQASLF